MLYTRGWQTFSAKGQIVCIVGLVSHMVSVAATRPCCCSAKAAMGRTQMNRHSWVPAKLYLQKQAVGCSSQTPVLDGQYLLPAWVDLRLFCLTRVFFAFPRSLVPCCLRLVLCDPDLCRPYGLYNMVST